MIGGPSRMTQQAGSRVPAAMQIAFYLTKPQSDIKPLNHPRHLDHLDHLRHGVSKTRSEPVAGPAQPPGSLQDYLADPRTGLSRWPSGSNFNVAERIDSEQLFEANWA